LINTISVIIPVLHEAERIDPLIKHLKQLRTAASPEIIVVDGADERDTLLAIREGGVVKIPSARGRARQMNAGAAAAGGNILLFLHADTRLPSCGLEKIADTMSRGRYSAGAFSFGFDGERRIFRITERYVSLRTRLTKIPFGDQAIFIGREYFEEIGGYLEIPVMEDVELMKRIKRRGDMICILPEKVSTSPRRWEKEGILYCTLRNWALQLLFSVGVSPERLAKFYE
jgi:rSAM/selenodomain-associated transferase 2